MDLLEVAKLVEAGVVLCVAPFILVTLRELRNDVRKIKDNDLLHIYEKLARLEERLDAD